MLEPNRVHGVLERHQLADGFPFVLDLEGSRGAFMRDAVTGKEYLDCFTSFASWPIGYNHPMMDDPAFVAELTLAAKNNPANSDLYTSSMAQFVDAFATHVTGPEYPHHFWVAGGALAVENAMKTAFDWKARKLGRTDMLDDVNDLVILHFRQAFHGRSGYTMSVTNTVPDKVGLFPKFDWPRVHNPAIVYDEKGEIANDIEAEEAKSKAEIEAAFTKHAGKIAAILIEPVQGEGGDNYFRPEFMQALRDYADQNEALLIFDEVQTGFFGTGKPWMFMNYGVQPDVVAFGKKTQVCGIFANKRVEEVEDNVFHRSSRINSTWGGNLVDMVRAKRFIEIIRDEKLCENIAERGCQVLGGLQSVAREHAHVSNVRGIGSWQAFTCESPAARDAMIASLRDHGVLVLASGPQSVRLRMPLTLSSAEADMLIERVGAAAGEAAAKA